VIKLFNPKRKETACEPVIRSSKPVAPASRATNPNRPLRIRPTKLRFSFRPGRFGVKPKIVIAGAAGLSHPVSADNLQPLSGAAAVIAYDSAARALK
jgi:hypothetical protein